MYSHACAQTQAARGCGSQRANYVQDLSALAALPDHLLAAVLTHACSTAANAEQRAAAAVRNLAQVALVCRRFRALLREHRPLLSLDFTHAPLTPAQTSWLTGKGLLCGVRAACFDQQ